MARLFAYADSVQNVVNWLSARIDDLETRQNGGQADAVAQLRQEMADLFERLEQALSAPRNVTGAEQKAAQAATGSAGSAPQVGDFEARVEAAIKAAKDEGWTLKRHHAEAIAHDSQDIEQATRQGARFGKNGKAALALQRILSKQGIELDFQEALTHGAQSFVRRKTIEEVAEEIVKQRTKPQTKAAKPPLRVITGGTRKQPAAADEGIIVAEAPAADPAIVARIKEAAQLTGYDALPRKNGDKPFDEECEELARQVADGKLTQEQIHKNFERQVEVYTISLASAIRGILAEDDEYDPDEYTDEELIAVAKRPEVIGLDREAMGEYVTEKVRKS